MRNKTSSIDRNNGLEFEQILRLKRNEQKGNKPHDDSVYFFVHIHFMWIRYLVSLFYTL